jgi:ADP-heptose:LPS heptosyltransferase
MSKPSRLDYAYAVGRVRALERYLIPQAVFREVSETTNFTAALKVIYDAGRYPEDLIKARHSEDLDAVLRQARRPYPSVRGQATLRELAWILRRARLFCGVDTVAMHLAAAVQTPVVALFGPSSEWSWRPWQTRHELALGPCACKQTRRFVCDRSRPYPCMEAITVETVTEKIQRLVGHA